MVIPCVMEMRLVKTVFSIADLVVCALEREVVEVRKCKNERGRQGEIENNYEQLLNASIHVMTVESVSTACAIVTIPGVAPLATFVRSSTSLSREK